MHLLVHCLEECVNTVNTTTLQTRHLTSKTLRPVVTYRSHSAGRSSETSCEWHCIVVIQLAGVLRPVVTYRSHSAGRSSDD